MAGEAGSLHGVCVVCGWCVVIGCAIRIVGSVGGCASVRSCRIRGRGCSFVLLQVVDNICPRYPPCFDEDAEDSGSLGGVCVLVLFDGLLVFWFGVWPLCFECVAPSAGWCQVFYSVVAGGVVDVVDVDGVL